MLWRPIERYQRPSTITKDLLGQERTANTFVDREIALLVTNPVVVTAETTRRQALGVKARIGVESTSDASQLVIEIEDAAWAGRRHGTLGGGEISTHPADTTTRGDKVQDQEQQGNDDYVLQLKLHLLKAGKKGALKVRTSFL